MSLIKGQATLERGLRAEFQKALQYQPNPILDSLFMNINSTGADEKYGWLGAVDSLVEWKDEKTVKSVIDHTYTVVNTPYEATIGVDRFDLADDSVGGAFMRTRDLTIRGRMFPQKLLLETIIANPTCYDGKAFFANDHEEGDSGAQDNLLTGTGVTIATITADFRAAVAAMLGFKDSAGEPIFETDVNMNLVVVCPTGLYGVFQELQNAAVISNTTNTIKGTFDLVPSSRLTGDDANDWYLFSASPMAKPFIKQERDPLAFAALEGDSDIGFTKRTYLYSVTWRGKIAVGFWQSAVKTTNT